MPSFPFFSVIQTTISSHDYQSEKSLKLADRYLVYAFSTRNLIFLWLFPIILVKDRSHDPKLQRAYCSANLP